MASAGYGGAGLTDAARVRRLLEAPVGVERHAARFRCVLALVAPWGKEALVEGLVQGVLTDAPRGAGGFGYDSIFLVPTLGRTFGELPPAEKDRLSHRADAVARAHPILAAWHPQAVRRARGGRPGS